MEIMNQFKPGDIVLINLKFPFAKLIEYITKRDRKKKGFIIPKGRLSNHVGMIISLYGELYVAQAVKNEIIITPFKLEFAGRFDRIKVISPKKQYSLDEQNKISKIAVQTNSESLSYKIFGFIYWVKQLFKKENSKFGNKIYSSEVVATWANKVRPRTFELQEVINPLDIENNRYYKVIYDGSEIE